LIFWLSMLFIASTAGTIRDFLKQVRKGFQQLLAPESMNRDQMALEVGAVQPGGNVLG
jgi:hypothetical protein